MGHSLSSLHSFRARIRTFSYWNTSSEISVCVAYRFEGETLKELPSDVTVLERCTPVFEKLPGWKSPTLGIREWADLPEAARVYVERLSELARAEVGLVSTGPDREHTIIRARSALTSWFD